MTLQHLESPVGDDGPAFSHQNEAGRHGCDEVELVCPRDRDFRRELDAELQRLREFLTPE